MIAKDRDGCIQIGSGSRCNQCEGHMIAKDRDARPAARRA